MIKSQKFVMKRKKLKSRKMSKAGAQASHAVASDSFPAMDGPEHWARAGSSTTGFWPINEKKVDQENTVDIP